ncbi:succinate dehydrogenase cytochrome b subunit [Nannocystis sp. SCPEA4]|uniref:succinate dehydrogenase cytochrome b subunit n=1 Tax=Nannocystis sp. SCPEA4 TaxID=2996787 RepID=UPI00226E9D46|nr:succinate dehydrogenase cytochrome b subunit [Nannocystis sp. SCPEA4]MCY1062286.1 succinate dehydrogenase cytochrome b subunit [Nannocystis sp. SCPEA4]
MTDAKRPGRLSTLAQSTIGAKIVMAVTGVILVGFLVVHMLGNLQIYLGPDTMNHYAQTLKGTPALLWGVRAVLLVSLVLHILAALRLKKLNTEARPQAYAVPRRYRVTTPAARFMLLSGAMVLAFIVYHLLHFTIGATNPADFNLHEVLDVATQTWVRNDNEQLLAKLPPEMVRHDVYSMFVRGFSNPIIAGTYLVAQLLLAMHLSHAVASMLHTLGLSKGLDARQRNITIGRAIAAVVVLGNISFPIAVQAGLVHL